MIDTKGMKLEPFLRKLALHVTGEGKAVFVEGENVVYLGAGYWRAAVRDLGDAGIWVSLINPSRTAAEIVLVEAAMSVLV